MDEAESLFRDEVFTCQLELRDMLVGDIPNHGIVYAKIGMNEHVPESSDLSPRYVRLFLSQLIR